MPLIAPSLLAADFLHLQDACTMLNTSEADWYHLDVMDGRFVPNISYGPMVVKQLRPATKKIFDVHLMIEEPEKYFEDFKNAGADHIHIHWEACPHLHRQLQQIKAMGMKAGIAINPHTPIHFLEDVLQEADMLCLMSVNPGFGGQKFIANTLIKIREAKKMIADKKLNLLIEVDGGVTEQNAAEIVAAGADVLVAGSSVFQAADPIAAIKNLKNC